MAKNDSDITPAVLLQHILAMRGDLTAQIQGVEKSLSLRLTKVETRLGSVETRLGHVETRLTRVERKVDVLTVGVDAIDKRLDDIEIELLPKRVKKLEEAVGTAA